MIHIKVLSSNEKVLFERVIYNHESVEVPFANIIKALDFLFQGVPHSICFINKNIEK